MNDSLISFVLPCYNEGNLAVKNTLTVYEYLRATPWNFELIVCDDASNDGSAEILKQLESRGIEVVHYEKGPSRRENLAVTLKQARGRILVYMDMDLSTSLDHLKEMIDRIQNEHYDIVIGSRYQKGAIVKRSFLRLFYSVCYNFCIRLLFGSQILDHQCGFKAFRKEAYDELCTEMGYDEKYQRGWFWDAELLIRAQRKHFAILEMPVRWMVAAKSSFHFFRELKVIPYMFQLRRRLANPVTAPQSVSLR